MRFVNRRSISPRWPALLAGLLLATPAHADLAKLDPRARAALGTLRGGVAIEDKRATAALDGAPMLDVFVTGDIRRHELEALGAVVRTELPGLCTASIPATAVEAIAALAGVTRIHGAAPVELELDTSVPTTGAHLLRGPAPTFTGYSGGDVLVGDVDSGVDFDHPDFDDELGNTRLVSVWDQTIAAGPAPAGFAYGTECSAAQIDAGACAQVDVVGHGTHVLGIAGGDGSGTGGAVPAFTYVGMAPRARLCMVKTTSTNTAVLDGVAYIFARATALGIPAVVNLSLGSHFGPHDGTSPFEAGLTALTGPGRIVVKSAGNEGGQARHAEVFAAGAGTVATMAISGSATGRLIGIDGYYEASEQLAVEITTPNGTVIGPVTMGASNAAYPGAATANGRVYLENGISATATGDREVYVEIGVQAGQTMNGTWTFRFIPVALGAANGEVDLWRFFNSTGTNANFVVGNQPTEELVSEPGNAVGVITTAAWTSKRVWTDCAGNLLNFGGAVDPGLLATFSSPGPTRDGRQKPDLAAPGAVIAAANSFDFAQGCAPTGSVNLPDGLMHTINQGTSMAAPHVSGAIALLLQKYGPITPTFARDFLVARARTDGFTGAVWNKDWGFGKLHLGDLIDPVATVVAPNGGETLQVGATSELTWNASDALGGVTTVDLELSRSGPAGPWEPIAGGIANSGAHPWLVTGPTTVDALLRVRAADAAGNHGEDTSNATFTIESAVPALLAFYEGTPAEGGVELRWRLADREAHGTFVVERGSAAEGPFEAVPVERRSIDGLEFAIDRAPLAGRTGWYRVGFISGEATTWFGPIAVSAGGAATTFALGTVAPNPAGRGAVEIAFALARDADIAVTIHDVRGRRVAVVADGLHAAGRHVARWNGQVDGAPAPAGLYFVRYASPAGVNARRLVIAG